MALIVAAALITSRNAGVSSIKLSLHLFISLSPALFASKG